MAPIQDSALSRRRGRPKSNQRKPPFVAKCLGSVICALFVVTYFVVTAKTHHSLQEIEKEIESEMTVEARNLMRRIEKEAPLKPTMVECRIRTETPWQTGVEPANGLLKITVRHDLAPTASKIFVDMVRADWFDGMYLFRVVRNFLIQFGIQHKELIEAGVTFTPPEVIKKDPKTESTLSNLKGTMGFANGNPKLMQIYINLVDNLNIDKEGNYPFATVDEAGMEVLSQLYYGYKPGMGQIKALTDGEDTIMEKFPWWSKIEYCKEHVMEKEKPKKKAVEKPPPQPKKEEEAPPMEEIPEEAAAEEEEHQKHHIPKTNMQRLREKRQQLLQKEQQQEENENPVLEEEENVEEEEEAY